MHIFIITTNIKWHDQISTQQNECVKGWYSSPVFGLRDFLRGSSELFIFADETLRLLPHGFLRVLQLVLQVGDAPVQRSQMRVRFSDLHRRRGRHVPMTAAQYEENTNRSCILLRHNCAAFVVRSYFLVSVRTESNSRAWCCSAVTPLDAFYIRASVLQWEHVLKCSFMTLSFIIKCGVL